MGEQFGGKVSKALKERYESSENWRDGAFQNLVKTTMDFHFQDLPKMMYKQFFERKNRMPASPIPVIPFDRESFLNSESSTQFIWYGHSVVLLNINGKLILIDPMLGPNASPIAPFKTKRYSEQTLELIDAFPQIDLVLMTHDHYDHLDLASIKRLKSKVNQFWVGLGVGRHLESWGIESARIKEFDWWDSANLEDISITYTPTRHFSGRGLRDRAKSLWGGWVMKTESENIYFSGDGGYGEHFKEVGKRLGPFDLGFMECGQYNENWHQIHMYPEESVAAAKDAQVAKSVPVHWAGFALALHTWTDPIERFVEESNKLEVDIMTPEIGEMVNYKLNNTFKPWWKAEKFHK